LSATDAATWSLHQLGSHLSGWELDQWPSQRFGSQLVQFGANHAGNQGRNREVLLKGMQPETAIEGAREGHAQPGRCFSSIVVFRTLMIGLGIRGRGWVRGLRGVEGSGVLTVGQSLKTQGLECIQFVTKSCGHAAI